MVAADLFRRCLALLQACPYPAWCYTGDNDTGHLPHGVEFSPDATTVAQWLNLAMKEKDPTVQFHPEGVTPPVRGPGGGSRAPPSPGGGFPHGYNDPSRAFHVV